jgi:hypothetical protein
VRKLICFAILILIVSPGISKGTTDIITDSEGEGLFEFHQNSSDRFSGMVNSLAIAPSRTKLDKFTQLEHKYTFRGATGEPGIASLINPLPATLKAGSTTKRSRVQSGLSDNASKETPATAGIYSYLDLFIEQMDSKGKVTYSSWGDMGFAIGDHDMKDGKFSGNVFSGSWDYEEANSHHTGKMDITLDDEIQKATKVVSFSAENTEQINNYGKITEKIQGTGESIPPPTWTKSNPWGPFDTATFQINGAGTCGSITSYNYEFIPYLDGLVHAIVRNYQCNNQSRLMIQFKLSDPCSKKIPLPKGVNSFDVGDVSKYSAEVPSAILGSDPGGISPIGFGKKTADGSPSSYHVKLCPFEGPVDLYFNVVPYFGFYFLDQNNKVRPLEKMEPWRANVTGAIDEVIAGDFGGLFDSGRLPKGEHGFQIIAVPAGVSFLEAYLDPKDAYLWKYVVNIECNGYTPMPTGKELFGISPHAVPVTGSDPEEIIPFSVGHYAVGGEIILMGVEFCPFDEPVDIHFGIYCPEDDPLRIYFANWEAAEEKNLFQKSFMLRFAFSPELPERPLWGSMNFDTDQEDQINIFMNEGVLASEFPKGSCQYIAAASPVGVRDKFYAWVLPLDINIKQAYIDIWKRVHQGDQSIKGKRKR